MGSDSIDPLQIDYPPVLRAMEHLKRLSARDRGGFRHGEALLVSGESWRKNDGVRSCLLPPWRRKLAPTGGLTPSAESASVVGVMTSDIDRDDLVLPQRGHWRVVAVCDFRVAADNIKALPFASSAKPVVS